MINWRARGKHLIKGFFSPIYALTSAIVITPKATHGLISPITPNGIGLVSNINTSTAISSPIAGTHSILSPLNSRGKGIKSPITIDGIGLLSPIEEPG